VAGWGWGWFAGLVRRGRVARRGWCGLREGGGGLALEGAVEDGDDVVDAAHAAAVAEFLRGGEAPWDFPGLVLVRCGGGREWMEFTRGDRLRRALRV
jgi:hypothetical protein